MTAGMRRSIISWNGSPSPKCVDAHCLSPTYPLRALHSYLKLDLLVSFTPHFTYRSTARVVWLTNRLLLLVCLFVPKDLAVATLVKADGHGGKAVMELGLDVIDNPEQVRLDSFTHCNLPCLLIRARCMVVKF